MNKLLIEIYSQISSEMSSLEKSLKSTFQANDKQLHNIEQYLYKSKGKKLRPALYFLICKVLGKQVSKADINFACAIELIHMASLVHDDIIDKADYRHGIECIHKVFGDEIGIVSGVYLYSKSLGLIAEIGNPELLKLVSSAVNSLCCGEIKEILNKNTIISEDTYNSIIINKTAVLFELAFKSACLLNDITGSELERFTSIGQNIGVLYQLVDDYLDLEDINGELLKSAGQDFKEGVVTLPSILLAKKIGITEMQDLLNNHAYEKYIELINKHNIKEDIIVTIDNLKNQLDNDFNSLNNYKTNILKKVITVILKRANLANGSQ